jgi:hypothetical protein
MCKSSEYDDMWLIYDLIGPNGPDRSNQDCRQTRTGSMKRPARYIGESRLGVRYMHSGLPDAPTV